MFEDALFVLINVLVLPAWLLMLIAPSARITERVVAGLWLPVAVAAVYLGVVLANVGATDGGFFSLDAIGKLFQHRAVILAGWAHYLCFDLVVASFEWRDARRIGLPHLTLAACLLLTLFWGPIGFLLYVVVRAMKTRSWAPFAEPEARG
jgi:hypothetical protein